ncbi:hypothetical protein FW774_10100 [Pedobacter sp. BS3]|uniref:hypothetical protein n=1 Tax=Pedobacter sp. BS3 TaxID=2567937 RepID=UPI0011EE1F8B|nr:hypothetical protein [Pedobacter sp. BS3]TZF83809.1 hypothetical protein FW774_10100 [Pedobacter sp. BS3]
MKKLFIATAMVSMLTASAYAFGDDKKSEKKAEASYLLQAQFDADFENAKHVEWAVTDSRLQKATFELDGVYTTAFYDMNNVHVATTQHVAASELPADARKELAKAYSGYTIGLVIKYLGDDHAYFVDLANDKEEFLVKVDPAGGNISFFKQVK